MKKLILILITLSFIQCKKDDKKSQPLEPTEAYCLYEQVDVNHKVFLECVKSQSEATSKVITYRDQGKSVNTVKKSTCSDC